MGSVHFVCPYLYQTGGVNTFYEIEVIEILKGRVQIEGLFETEALNKIEEKYVEEDIALDAMDYSDIKFEVRDRWSVAKLDKPGCKWASTLL